jgi:hypothetical protein
MFMSSRNPGITPGHPLLKEYARSLAEIQAQGYSHELALRPAFQNLLADSARLYGWTFISEPSVRVGKHTIRPDGLVRDGNNFPRGYWEAKDSKDKLEREIDHKLRNDYPAQNTIFEDTQRAILYQDRQPVLKADLSDSRELSDLLFRFFSHTEPEIRRFEEAVDEFKIRIPQHFVSAPPPPKKRFSLCRLRPHLNSLAAPIRHGRAGSSPKSA